MFRPDPQKDETSQSLLRTVSRRGLFSPVSFSIMRFDQVQDVSISLAPQFHRL
jgi:hypothetical protein